MTPLIVRANAKLNITLDIIGKRNDGYHDIESIIQEIDLSDEIEIADSDKTDVLCDNKLIPCGKENICYKAVELLKKEFHLNKNFLIKIKKIIPVGSGLGGGSSDCAATLNGLNNLCNLGIKKEKLVELGMRLGSDVGFFIVGGACSVSGRGEKISKLDDFPKMNFIVVYPGFASSTKEAYLMVENISSKKFSEKILNDMSIQNIIDNLHNDFEEKIILKYPILGKIKKELISLGAEGALMSGSGSCVFGIFQDENKMQNVYKKLKKNHQFVFETRAI